MARASLVGGWSSGAKPAGMPLCVRGRVAWCTGQSGYPVAGRLLHGPGRPLAAGGDRMETLQAQPRVIQGVRRRELLKAGLAAGVTLSAWPLQRPSGLWAADAGPPKRGGILRVRGYDPPHFDPQLTLNFKTNTTLS